MTLQEELLLFSHREIKAKDVFYIKEIAKPQAYEFVSKYHYLGDAKFFCEQAFGLFAIHEKPLSWLVVMVQDECTIIDLENGTLVRDVREDWKSWRKYEHVV